MNWLNKVFMPLGIVSGLLLVTQLPEMCKSTVYAASILGIVTDENGDAIEDAVIKIKNQC